MQNLFTIQTVAIFVVIALPGIIGQVFYSLSISKPIDELQDKLVSIFAFGCLNFVLVAWPLLQFVEYPFVPATFGLWNAIVSVVCLLIAPVLLGILAARALKAMTSFGWISQGNANEWDAAINWARRQQGIVTFVVETKDDKAIAGRFDSDAFTAVSSQGGGLFFAKAWRVRDGHLDMEQEPWAEWISKDRISEVSIKVDNYDE